MAPLHPGVTGSPSHPVTLLSSSLCRTKASRLSQMVTHSDGGIALYCELVMADPWLRDEIDGEEMSDLDGVLIEAESFDDKGGWNVDTQFIHIMGSPYLIAHGLGKPVAPANTSVTLPAAGQWYVWVRTKNWVAGDWEAPGRFTLAVNGDELSKTFGTESGEWGWEAGGAVELDSSTVALSLIDQTGFDGRCDAIFFSQDENAVPDNSSEPMNAWRRRHGQVEDVDDAFYDLIVVGGGIAGSSAAISGARAGLRVALLQNRSVLGGNGSPEVEVAPAGNYPPGRYPDLGDIVKEVSPVMDYNPDTRERFSDAETKRRAVVDAEPNLDLFMDHHVYHVETEGARISSVWALNTLGHQRRHLIGRYFVDATGHGTVGLQAGADYRMEPGDRMGMTNIWRWRWTDEDVAFPKAPWALQLTEKGFPYPTDGGMLNKDGEPAKIRFDDPLFFAPAVKGGKGDWHWESGFNKHPLNDLEAIRDHNMRAAFGAFNALKHHGAYASLDPSGRDHATAELYSLNFIGGTRETLQLLGDVVVEKKDVHEQRDFPDACVPATWGIDLHYPMPLFARENPDNPFISRAHFDGRIDDSKGRWVDSPRKCLEGDMRGVHDEEKGYLFPYRAFYSRNIENLFMAGRDLSVSHEALGTIRVMNTLGMVGVVVGRAASLACKHDATNRAIYEDHFDELKELIAQPGDYRHSEG